MITSNEQADRICREALPMDVYNKLEEKEKISTANTIMFYSACIIQKINDGFEWQIGMIFNKKK